jgi:hypothetical protein
MTTTTEAAARLVNIAWSETISYETPFAFRPAEMRAAGYDPDDPASLREWLESERGPDWAAFACDEDRAAVESREIDGVNPGDGGQDTGLAMARQLGILHALNGDGPYVRGGDLPGQASAGDGISDLLQDTGEAGADPRRTGQLIWAYTDGYGGYGGYGGPA